MIKVFILCPGLGYIRRGYESFAQEIFDALSKDNYLDITLFKGRGKSSSQEIVLWNLPYHANLARKISRVFKKVERRDPYFVQLLSFFISIVPHIHIKKPDIIFFSEPSLGTFLLQWRHLTKQNYKLLFKNGGPCTPTLFYRWDHILQLSPTHFRAALDVGVPAEKQTLLFYGVHMNSEFQTLTTSEREALRHKLELPEKQPLILSVAAINNSHKRMNYVIREVASLSQPRPYLLLLGQQGEESAEILKLGNELLGKEHFQIRTVAYNQVADYYKIADAFVLASLSEGFGRVFLEAMSYGLPCLAHDYETPRYILGKEGYFANFELAGSLASLIPQSLAESHDISKQRRRHRTIYERFSWDQARPEYIKLFQKCINS
ncbi:glycosyltransferase family 4 protein [Fischerella thermalis]|uniref:Glycosyl transferase n=1 Tax=Fischerella thermalis CCMEE 5318 TaxID=2019666 RepID=A0A2N6LP13_9CYAN|nr:glycosyltransferase family 4 protein [Fischerella thermalis]PMB27441.1 glycosyl transferase [Fischerella thermalis CCMEE 5318]